MKKIFSMILAVLALVGCSQYDELTAVKETELDETLTIQATIDLDDDATRASLGEVGDTYTPILWKVGDEFSVKIKAGDFTHGELPVYFSIAKTEDITNGGRSAKFKYNTTKNVISIKNFVENTPPGAYTATFGTGSSSSTASGNKDEVKIFMKADFTIMKDTDWLTLDLSFKPQNAIVELTLQNNAFKNRAVTAIALNSGGEQKVVTNAPITGDNEGKVTAYMTMSVGDGMAFSDATVTAKCNDYDYKASLGNKTLVKGKLYRVNKTMEVTDIPYFTLSSDVINRISLGTTDSELVGAIQYSRNGKDWYNWPNDFVEFGKDWGDLRIRGKLANGTYISETRYIRITEVSTQMGTFPGVKVSGDIRTLVDWEDYKHANTSQASFKELFYEYEKLISAKDLILASTLAEGCYGNMFLECISLTDTPELPATVLAKDCYKNMFRACVKLKKAPKLPAKTLVDGCYSLMFYDCQQLEEVTMLATDMADGSTQLSCLSKWLTGVAASGTIYKDSSFEIGNSFIPDGWDVKDYVAQ